MERHSFRTVSGESLGNCAFPQNFHTRKLGKSAIFFTVNTPYTETIRDNKTSHSNMFYVMMDLSKFVSNNVFIVS